MATNIADRIFASSAAGPLNGFAARTLKKEQVGLTGRPERWADQSAGAPPRFSPVRTPSSTGNPAGNTG